MEIQFERRLDELHRVVLPSDLCRMLRLGCGDTVAIDMQDGKITLTPRRAE